METFAQRRSYNRNPEDIRTDLITLDDQMKIFHKDGYVVDVNPESIQFDGDMFVYTSFRKGFSEEERRKNIEDLAKLAVGTYYSIPSGTFVDYTNVSTEYLRKSFDSLQMSSSILKAADNDCYYHDVIVEGRNDVYYNDYLVKLAEYNASHRTNTRVVVKSLGTLSGADSHEEPHPTGLGIPEYELYKDKQSAFIDIIFYPVLTGIGVLLTYVITILLRIL